MGLVLALKGVQQQHQLTTTSTPPPNVPFNNQNSQNNQGQYRQLRQFPKGRTYTPLGEPIEEVLKKCIQNGVITLQEPKPYDPGQFKPAWWNDNAFCEYH